MRDRPTERRGLLRAVRRHPGARLCAVLALFTFVLLARSPLWVPAVERGDIEICTANGIRIIPADLPVPDDPSSRLGPKQDCPLCTIQAAVLLPPAACTLEAFGDGVSIVALPNPSCDITGRFAGFDRFSRAPPILS
jgi:hypothetical protein